MAQNNGSIFWGVVSIAFLFGGMWYGKQLGMDDYAGDVELNAKRILEQYPNQDDAFHELTKNYGVLTDLDRI